jgi:hypothetical protein
VWAGRQADEVGAYATGELANGPCLSKSCAIIRTIQNAKATAWRYTTRLIVLPYESHHVNGLRL